MNKKKLLYILLFFIITNSILLIFAKFQLGGNFSFKNITPAPYFISCILSCLLFNSTQVLIHCLFTIILKFTTLHFQADYLEINTIFTQSAILESFLYVIIPFLISELIEKKTAEIELLKTKALQNDIFTKTLNLKNNQLQKEIKEIGQKFTQHSLSDLEFMDQISSIIRANSQDIIQNIRNFSLRYLGTDNIEIYTDQNIFTINNGQKIQEYYFKHPKSEYISSADRNFPLEEIDTLVIFSKNNNKVTYIFVNNIPFKLLTSPNISRLCKIVDISVSTKEFQLRIDKLNSSQIYNNQSKIFSYSAFKALGPLFHFLNTQYPDQCNSYKITLNRSCHTLLADHVISDTWSKILSKNEYIFSTENSNEYIYFSLDNIQTNSNFYKHISENLRNENHIQRIYQ